MGRGFAAGSIWGILLGASAIALSTQLADRRDLRGGPPESAALETLAPAQQDNQVAEIVPEVEDPVVVDTDAAMEDALPVEEDVVALESIVEEMAEDIAEAVEESVQESSEETGPSEPEVVQLPQPGNVPQVDQPEAISDGPTQLAAPLATDIAVPELNAPDVGSDVALTTPGRDAPEIALATPSAPSSLAEPERGPAAVSSVGAQPVAPSESTLSTLATASLADTAVDSTIPSAPGNAAVPERGPYASATDVRQPIAPAQGSLRDVLTGATDQATALRDATVLAQADIGAAPNQQESGPDIPEAEQTSPGALVRPLDSDAELNPLQGTGLPQPGFRSAPGIVTDRLPRVGDDGSEAGESENTEELDPRAVVRFAAPFDNVAGDPIISVVLLHQVGTEPDTSRGLDINVPISFAVRASDPDAARVAAAYRASGREVVLIPSLPPGATPVDVEVALSANFNTVPEAVALMDVPETGFQSERTAVSQVVSILSDTGHGLVTFPRGLNTAHQLASQGGLPAQLVLRDIDVNGGSTENLVRLIDRAAFRARQEGAVILVGRNRPETVDAIVTWAVGNGQSNVVLAPISATLLAQ